MIDNKLKHLEFIQNILSRMNSNSFLVKGWTINLLTALITLCISFNNKDLSYIGLIVITVFWTLDGFFISRERLFRNLYGEVARMKNSEIDFSMNISKYKNYETSWLAGIFSKTLIPIYLFMYLSSFLIMFIIN